MNITDAVHVGTPSVENVTGWQIFTFHIHELEKVDRTTAAIDVPLDIPPFKCFGRDWKLLIYPVGTLNSSADYTMLYLQHLSDGEITIDWNSRVKCLKKDVTLKEQFNKKVLFRPGVDRDGEDSNRHGNIRCIGHSRKLFMNRHTLTIEVSMRCESDDQSKGVNFVPTNQFGENMKKLFLDYETGDVTFAIDGTSMCAHLAVLKNCAPTLFSLCKTCGKGKDVPITGVNVIIFHIMLEYVYGKKLPAKELEGNARGLIDAADRFGVINLKVEAETMYVSKFKFTVDNVIEQLLYADSKNLALLKEAAMNFIYKNAVDVLSTDSFKTIPADRNILSELLSVVAMKNAAGSAKKEEDDPGDESSNKKTVPYKSMSVTDLRWQLAGRDLDVDGSREMLIARLEEHDSNKETASGKKRKNEEI